MCGRYVTPEQAAIEREYQLTAHESTRLLLEPNYNASPTEPVPVLRVVREAAGQREVIAMRWGLIPFYTRGEPPRYPTINATIERLETAPAWRGAWKRGQRCIAPAMGFYEWQMQEDGKTRQPYYIRPAEDGTTFALAGLWDTSTTPDGERILSCVVITMPANDLMAQIHNTSRGQPLPREGRRMPAILQKDDIDVWLSGTPAQAKAVLKQYPSDQMIAWPVSTRVNSPKNKEPDLIQPVDVPQQLEIR